MKQLFTVSVLILAVIVSLACEGPAPTPAAPPAPELTMPPATQVVPPMPSPTANRCSGADPDARGCAHSDTGAGAGGHAGACAYDDFQRQR